jgi:ubiquinone/menaquinone biosynthesis C-methylase UbiE
MTLAPNHHADHPAPKGLAGFISGATMVFGRASLARLAAQIGALEPGEHVVDIGSGPGAGARLAAKLGATVTGIEPAQVMRTWAARTTWGDPPIRWVDAVAQSMPLDDDSVDLAWSISTVHHWPELTGGIAEIARVLRPGGRFVVVEKTSPPDATGLASHGWTLAQGEAFAARCTEAGFVPVHVAETRRGRREFITVCATNP